MVPLTMRPVSGVHPDGFSSLLIEIIKDLPQIAWLIMFHFHPWLIHPWARRAVGDAIHIAESQCPGLLIKGYVIIALGRLRCVHGPRFGYWAV